MLSQNLKRIYVSVFVNFHSKPTFFTNKNSSANNNKLRKISINDSTVFISHRCSSVSPKMVKCETCNISKGCLDF